MLDELKEVKHFKEVTVLIVSDNVKYFKEIKRSQSLQKAEAHIEPKRASTMELFCVYI